jgi:hypothetical protein
MGSPTRQQVANGRVTINISLPRQGVSLLTITD